MVEHEKVTVTFDMLPEDAEKLVFENGRAAIVGEFEYHAEPEKVAFGEVLEVERE